jgi:hypothetical protein
VAEAPSSVIKSADRDAVLAVRTQKVFIFIFIFYFIYLFIIYLFIFILFIYLLLFLFLFFYFSGADPESPSRLYGTCLGRPGLLPLDPQQAHLQVWTVLLVDIWTNSIMER